MNGEIVDIANYFFKYKKLLFYGKDFIIERVRGNEEVKYRLYFDNYKGYKETRNLTELIMAMKILKFID